MQNEILCAHKVTNNTLIRLMTANEDNRILGAQKFRDTLFKLTMKWYLAGNDTTGASGGSILGDGVLRRFGNLRMTGRPNIIVR